MLRCLLLKFKPRIINESIKLLLQGGVAYEFRTTVIREYHEAQDFEEMGMWIEGADCYFLQPFTDRDTVPNRFLNAPDAADLRLYREIIARHVQLAEIRGLDY